MNVMVKAGDTYALEDGLPPRIIEIAGGAALWLNITKEATLKHFIIASDEGAERYQAELGAEVELDITKDEELAVVAAGWLEPAKKAKEASK